MPTVPIVAARERLMTPKDGTRWHDRVAARSLLSFSWRRPVRRAASVRVPFLLVVPEADSIAPVPAALKVARKAPQAELFRSAGGHYDVARATYLAAVLTLFAACSMSAATACGLDT